MRVKKNRYLNNVDKQDGDTRIPNSVWIQMWHISETHWSQCEITASTVHEDRAGFEQRRRVVLQVKGSLQVNQIWLIR